MFSESIHSLADTINQVPKWTLFYVFRALMYRYIFSFCFEGPTKCNPDKYKHLVLPKSAENNTKKIEKNVIVTENIYFTIYSFLNALHFKVLSVTVFIPYWDLGKHFEVLKQL